MYRYNTDLRARSIGSTMQMSFKSRDSMDKDHLDTVDILGILIITFQK